MKKILVTDRYIPSNEMCYYNRLKADYINAINKSKNLPIIVPTSTNLDAVKEYVKIADGIIFTGGEDISPNIYNEDFLPQVKQISVVRDEFEKALFFEALENNIPILGICRGLQLINSLMGGSLYQDIYTQIPGCSNHNHNYDMNHGILEIEIEKDSYLYNAIKKDRVLVNCEHHQAVKKVAHNFRVTSKSKDGIIQSMDYLGDRYIHLVQFHPESLVDNYPEFINIFKKFVERS